MRNCIYILVLFFGTSLYGQQLPINSAGGEQVTINASIGTTVNINKQPLSATYPIEYKAVAGDQATAIVIIKGEGVVYYHYLDESDVVIFSGDISMDTGPPIETIKTSVFTALSLTDLQPINFADSGGLNYVAFGNLVHFEDQAYAVSIRRGNTHIGGGRITTQPYNSLTRTFGTRVVISRDASEEIRGGSNCVIGNQIFFFTTLASNNSVTFHGLMLAKSTDLTGTSWTEEMLLYRAGTNGGVSETAYARFNFYGTPVNIPGTQTWYVPWFEHNNLVEWRVNFIKTTDNFATWSTHNISSGAVDPIGEAAMEYVGNNTIIAMGRVDGNEELRMNISYDLGDTWEGWQSTNLGSTTGRTMCSLLNTPEYGLLVAFAPRGTGTVKLSIGNSVADILADPTAFNEGVTIFTSSGTDSYNMLGYPSMLRVAQHRIMIHLSEEITSTYARLYVADGSIESLITP